MHIAHISDFHVFADAPETSLVRADATAVARKVVADIVSFAPRIDAVMFTGDLTDGGSAADYALLAEILAPLSAPVFVVPGNHDRRVTMRAAFGALLPFTDGAFLNYETRVGNLRVLALDTLIEGSVEGRLDATQLAWLADRLEENHAGLTYILMHHPAFPSGIVPLDHMALGEGRDEMGALIAAYRRPLRILAGHIHRPYQAMWNGVFCAVGGSPAFQHQLDLRPDAAEPGAVTEPFAYFIHQIDGPDTVSIHTRYVSL